MGCVCRGGGMNRGSGGERKKRIMRKVMTIINRFNPNSEKLGATHFLMRMFVSPKELSDDTVINLSFD